MLKNYLIIAIRNILRHKAFSLINIFGLGCAIAIVILIGQYLHYEFSYDRYLENIDRIYQLIDYADESFDVDYRIKERILQEVPGVEEACLYNQYSVELNYQEDAFVFDHMLIVDPAYFRLFDVPFIVGDASQALSDINSVVLTESAARRIFPNGDPLGKPITLDHQVDMVVTGIVEDFPENSSFQADLFVSYENTPRHRLRYGMNCLTYDGVDDSQCRYPFRIFLDIYPGADVDEVEGQIAALYSGDDFRFPNTLSLTPFKDSYLHNRYSASRLSHGNMGLLRLLSYVALLVLALAVGNYINLTMAGYTYRYKEIGVKKSIGVGRRPLILQFLGESSLITVLAALAGISFAELFLPYFNRFIGKELHLQIFSDLGLFSIFILFILLLGVVAGLYPSLALSRISPVQLIQSKTVMGKSRAVTRNILIIFQFTATTALVIGLLLIIRQIDYVKHSDLGFDSEQLVNISLHHRISQEVGLPLINRLSQSPNLESMSLTGMIPGAVNLSVGGYRAITIDENFLPTFKLSVIEGRDLLPGDLGKACLVNQAALQEFENGDFRGQRINDLEVVGVVPDFHFSSLHEEIGPLALLYYGLTWRPSHISMRIAGPVTETIAYIRETWKEIVPEFPLEYQFYDDWFDSMYRTEENLALLISIFAIQAIVISSLGLLGLVLFAAEQRKKEIGIRKVLGSSVVGIIVLITKSFAKLALVANVIAWPVAWFVMNRWLENFAYRIDLGLGTFLLAGLLVLVIALATVSVQAVKVATANPVDALRYE